MTKQAIAWRKLPSVTREGKSFYNSNEIDGTRYTVSQSWLTHYWNVSDNHGACWGSFFSAKEAMRAVETL